MRLRAAYGLGLKYLVGRQHLKRVDNLTSVLPNSGSKV